MKYLVFGSKGQLGAEFLKALKGEVFGFDLDELDITDEKALKETIDSIKPDFVINCAAYNNVDKVETDYGTAFKVNALAVKNMALFSEKYKSRVVHFGTDYVFPGKDEKTPYTEEEKTGPLNKYGLSKLEGEDFLRELSPSALILRLSWVYGNGEQNFIHKLKVWAAKNPVLKISTDEISVPTCAEAVKDAALKAMERGLSGTWHLTAGGFASRYEWAKAVAESRGWKSEIKEAKRSDFALPARRPGFSAMSNSRLSRELGLSMPHWKEQLEAFLKTGTRNA